MCRIIYLFIYFAVISIVTAISVVLGFINPLAMPLDLLSKAHANSNSNSNSHLILNLNLPATKDHPKNLLITPNAQNKMTYEVLSFAPYLTDLLQELDLDRYVKGVSDDGFEFKKQKIYQNTPLISDARSIFQEEILKIIKNNDHGKNTLIALLWENGNPKSFEDILKKHNIAVVYFKTKSIQDVFYTAYYLIYLLHPPEKREFYLNKVKKIQMQNLIYKKQKQLIAQAIHPSQKPQESIYFFQPIWSKPWMILNGNNYSNDFLAHCGLENAFKNAPSMQISEEALLQTPFEHVIYSQNSEFNELFALKRFDVFQKKKWHAVDTNLLIRPNLKHIEQLPDFCQKLLKNN